MTTVTIETTTHTNERSRTMKQRFSVAWTGEAGASRYDFVEAEPSHQAIMEAAAQCLIDETRYDEAEAVPTPGDVLEATYETHCILDGWVKESAVQCGGQFHVNDLRNFSAGAVESLEQLIATADSGVVTVNADHLSALRDNLSHVDGTLACDYGLVPEEPHGQF